LSDFITPQNRPTVDYYWVLGVFGILTYFSIEYISYLHHMSRPNRRSSTTESELERLERELAVTISEEELITDANGSFSTGRTVPGRG
jgi:hypothetical protein